MRNVFNQYMHPENRLSHALACSLHEDEGLLRVFLRWSGCPNLDRGKGLRVVEQQIPGEILDGADETRGLPDISVFSDDACLLVESKVAARIEQDQLRRHRRTAERAGFATPHLLVISTESLDVSLPHGATAKSWSDLYTLMLAECRRSEWARRLVQYMEVIEIELAQKEYLLEGTLTQFSGIAFDQENPYRYDQAKRILRLMLGDLRSRKDLLAFGISSKAAGRPAITGSKGPSIWDFLRLREVETGPFTKHPHLTLSMFPEHLAVMVTLPNSALGRYRQHLKGLSVAELRSLLCELTDGIEIVLRGMPKARPAMYVLQRHYPSQRSRAIEDARLSFDLRTALPTRRGKVHIQPEWFETTHRVISAKRANTQLGIGAEIPYDSEVVRSRNVLDHIAGVWLALGPWLERGLGVHRRG